MRLFLSFLLTISTLSGLDLKTNLENNNILGYQKSLGTLNYNRLRLYLDLSDKRWKDINAKMILDNENFYNLKGSKNRNKSSFYRAYINYTGEKHMFVVGLQRIPFGVGRIWNPIDVFNPIDITSIETNERKGTESIRYEYAINELSNFDITLSKNRHALRIKGYLNVADFALIFIKDKRNSLDIVGVEAEGELLNTDITLRGEGGRFLDTKTDESYYSYILGVERGFENSIILLAEFYQNTKLKTKQLALNLSYQPSPIWTINLLGLGSLDNKTLTLSPSFTYSLSDESTLVAGAFFNSKREDRFFVNYFINF